MPADKIMLIRHAEKPSDDGTVAGVSSDGAGDKEELTVRGWQRSGALLRFFAPPDGKFADQGLATPTTIFASKVGKHSNSLRPQHTVLELSKALKLKLNLTYAKGDEGDLAKAVVATRGPVLVAWEHETIPNIANAIVGDTTTCPQKWPGSRFDLVWIFDDSGAGKWTFSQIPQMLLSGDSPATIPWP
jgi:hypothetical protein